MKRMKKGLLSIMLISAVTLFSAAQASAQQTECEGVATKIKSVSLTDYHPIKALYQFPDWGQFPDGNLQVLMSTEVTVAGPGRSCLMAHFSAMAIPTDNYMVFQVRVDGVPMEGHIGSFGGIATPVVATIEETDQNYPRMVAYNFFAKVTPGLHTVEVLAAAGSGIAPPPANQPVVGSPVLTLKYK